MLDVRKIRLTLELRNWGIIDSDVLSVIEKIPREIFVSKNRIENEFSVSNNNE